MPRTVFSAPADEDATTRFQGVVVNEAGARLAWADISAMTLTLYNEGTGAIVNSRTAANVYNVEATGDASGNFVLTLLPADMVIVDTTLLAERRVALLQYTYSSGKKGKTELVFTVRNLHRVP